MLSVAIIARTNTARTHIAQCILTQYWSRLSAVYPKWAKQFAALEQSGPSRLPCLYLTSCGIHHTQPVHALTRKLLEESKLVGSTATHAAENVYQANILTTQSNKSLFTQTTSIDCVVHIEDASAESQRAASSDNDANITVVERPTLPAHWKTPCVKLQYCAKWYTLSPLPRPQRYMRVRAEDSLYNNAPPRRSGITKLPNGIVEVRKFQSHHNREPEPLRRRRFQDEYQGEPMFLEYVPMATHAREQHMNTAAAKIPAGRNSNYKLDQQSAYTRTPYTHNTDELNDRNMIFREARLQNVRSGLNPQRKRKWYVDSSHKDVSFQGSKILQQKPARIAMPQPTAEDLEPIRASVSSMPGARNLHEITDLMKLEALPGETEAQQYERFLAARDLLALEMQKVVLRLLGGIGVVRAGALRRALSTDGEEYEGLLKALRDIFGLQLEGNQSAKIIAECPDKESTVNAPTVFDEEPDFLAALADELDERFHKVRSPTDSSQVDLLADDAL